MVYQNCLTDPEEILVADTSVLINLIATNHSQEILRLIQNPVFITENVLYELKEGQNTSIKIKALVESKRLKVITLQESHIVVFEKLITGYGAANLTLDDGEAATIAFASVAKAVALIDEKKGLAICKNEFPNLKTASSFELLTHDNVKNKLGVIKTREVLCNALIRSRMRVLPVHYSPLIQIVGVDFAKQCKSLPKKIRDML